MVFERVARLRYAANSRGFLDFRFRVNYGSEAGHDGSEPITDVIEATAENRRFLGQREYDLDKSNGCHRGRY